MFTVGYHLVFFLALCLLGEVVRRHRARIARLERSQTIDPSTSLGTPYALQRELSHAEGLPCELSVAEIQIPDTSRAKEAANALRGMCAHGMDQLYCLDLARGSFLLISYGKLDPEQVADYFHSELQARQIDAKIAWAYTRSLDPAIRGKVRQAARAALDKVAGSSGLEIATVEPDSWPADTKTEIILGTSLRSRRVALCLTRKELAPLLRLSDTALRDLETGRAGTASTAKFVSLVLDTIEQSVEKVIRLERVTALRRAILEDSKEPGAGGRQEAPNEPPSDTDQLSVIIARQQEILAARGSSAGPASASTKPGGVSDAGE